MVHAVDVLGSWESKETMQAVRRELAAYRASRQCMWPGCSDTPRGSHVISETFLRRIATSGQLVSPTRSAVAVALAKLAKKNVPSPMDQTVQASSASVFHGYCDEHEKEFRVFEDDPPGRLTTQDHCMLQLCRTVASELEERTELIVILEAIETENASSQLTGGIDAVRQHARILEVFLSQLHQDLVDPGAPGSIEMWCGDAPEPVGTAISYVDFLSVKEDAPDSRSEVGLAVAVVPQPAAAGATGFLVILASNQPGVLREYLRSHVGHFDSLTGTFAADPGRVSPLVQRWIEDGCFTWWMSPQRWSALSPAHQQGMVARLMQFP